MLCIFRRKAKALKSKIFTSQFRREMGRYEPHSAISSHGFSGRVIDASVSVRGSDPQESGSGALPFCITFKADIHGSCISVLCAVIIEP